MNKKQPVMDICARHRECDRFGLKNEMITFRHEDLVPHQILVSKGVAKNYSDFINSQACIGEPKKMLVSTKDKCAAPKPEVCDRIIRLKELLQLIALSRATVYDRLNPKSKRFDPSFPRPIKLGAASVGWSLNEVMAWIAARPQANPIPVLKDQA
ncbi:helix-turn-helix transcriptional regulator [Aeromonas jandaei]|nr:AlpA family transcriptional regulator [Aeromonas jandaei]